MAGLFFCLASAKGAGLLFCPAAIQPHTSVYSVFCRVDANYTTHAAKQRIGLYMGFSCNCTSSTAADTRPTQAAIYHLRHARAYHSAVAPPTRARYHSRAGTLYRPAQPPIIIRYIRAQHIADHASPAGSAPTVCGSLAIADTLSAVQTRRTC